MEATERIEFLQRRSFTEIINVTFTFIRQNFKTLGKPVLFIAGPAIIVTALVSGLNQASMMPGQGSLSMDYFWGTFGLSMLLSLLTGALMTCVVYGYILSYMERSTPTIEVDEVWQQTRRHFGKVLLAFILLCLMMGVGFMLCLLPGIYLAVALSFTLFVLMREQTGIGSAISRSFELVSAHWWFTFGLLFVVFLIQGVLALIFYVPQFVITFTAELHQATQGEQALYRYLMIASTFVATIGYYLFYAIPLVALAFHYGNLVERKEAAGLLQQVDEIGTQTGAEGGTTS